MGPARGKFKVIGTRTSKPRLRDVMTIGMLASHSACIDLAYAWCAMAVFHGVHPLSLC